MRISKTKSFYFMAGGIITALAFIMIAPTRSSRFTPEVSVVKQASPSVVNVSTETAMSPRENPFSNVPQDKLNDDFFRDFIDPRYGRRANRTSLGSGVIIDPAGHILTNMHVVMTAGKIIVTLIDGKSIEAEVIGADGETDLAVLRLLGKEKYPALKAGNSDNIMVGETAIAIGNPFGLGHTVTRGVVSATKRSIQAENKIFLDFIQTDASINPGNSGGPLLNADGELIGINSAIYQKAQGIGFAIPINRAKIVFEDLIRYGEVQTGWLGIMVRDLTNTTAQRLEYRGPGGVIVSLIVDGGPAQKAGLKYGDVIEEMNGIPIRTKADYRSFARMIHPGKSVKIKVGRKSGSAVMSVVASGFPVEMADTIARYVLGIQVVAAPSGAQGVMVKEVIAGSVSEKIRLMPNDIIHRLNNYAILNVNDWRKAVSKLYTMDSALLLVQRGRGLYYVTLPVNP